MSFLAMGEQIQKTVVESAQGVDWATWVVALATLLTAMVACAGLWLRHRRRRG